MNDELNDAIFEKPDLFTLEGRTVVVSGAGSGLGRTTAILLARHGADIVLADNQPDRLEEIAEEFRSAGLTGMPVLTDVSDRSSVENLVAKAVELRGTLYGMCNAAGVSGSLKPFLELTDQEWDKVLKINAYGVFVATQVAARAMVPERRGSIVNFSSTAIDMRGMVEYGVSKQAVSHITRTAADELGPLGIRVNAVAPGYIETPMALLYIGDAEGRIDEAKRDQMRVATVAQTVLPNSGQRMDAAAAVLYLISDAAAFVTGQTLRVNGGKSMV